jgi:hypothetical protein
MNQKEHELKHERLADELDALWDAVTQRENAETDLLKEIEELKKKLT